MVQLGEKVNLIICQKSKVDDWVDHFAKHYKRFIVIDLTKRNSIEDFLLYVKSMDRCLNDGLVGVINYELAWRRPELLKLKDFTMMLDESSLIQNKKQSRRNSF